MVTNEKIKVISHRIIEELDRACEKFPEWPTDPIHAVNIITEEVGELAQEAHDSIYDRGDQTIGDFKRALQNEAIQTATMAIRFLIHMDDYDFEAKSKKVPTGYREFLSKESE